LVSITQDNHNMVTIASVGRSVYPDGMAAERRDLLASVLPLAKALRRIEDAAAAEHGITMWQYAILSVAAAAPGMNQSEMASGMGYSKNRIVADIDQLEQHELLRRQPGADRRVHTLRATDAGIAAMRAIRTEIHRREDELLAGISATAQREFHRSVRRLGEQISGR